MPLWAFLVGVPAIVDSVVVIVVALKIVPAKIARATADMRAQVAEAERVISEAVVAGATAIVQSRGDD